MRIVGFFGCLCYVYNNKKPKDKFRERSKRCIFIGYPHGKKGWRVHDLENGNIFISRDVIFCKEKFPFCEVKMDEDPKGWYYDHISPIPHCEIGLNNETFLHETHGPA